MKFPQTSPAGRVRPNQPTFPLLDVIAAATVAFRKNHNTILRIDCPAYEGSTDGEFPATPECISNKTITLAVLKEGLITDEARAEAAGMVQALQTNMTFSILTGKVVSTFMQDIHKSLEKDTVLLSEVGRTLYVPSLYAGIKSRENLLEAEIGLRNSSKALGEVGAKVTINFTLISDRYVETFNCFAAFGKDDQGNLVSFLTGHKGLCATGKITGKVKFANPDKFHGNAIVTNLNFVKAVS